MYRSKLNSYRPVGSGPMNGPRNQRDWFSLLVYIRTCRSPADGLERNATTSNEVALVRHSPSTL